MIPVHPPMGDDPTARYECPADHKHDRTGTCYNNHYCRCALCSTANAERCALRRRTERPAATTGPPVRIRSIAAERQHNAIATLAGYILADTRTDVADVRAAAAAELRARTEHPELFALADDLAEAELLRRERAAAAGAQSEPSEERFAA